MSRLTIFAKGNLDVRDSLHGLRIGGVTQWNGINEVLRARAPGVTARVKHETWTRSDALLAADGTVPASLAARGLDLGAYPAASQFSTAVFEPGADVTVLSIQPDALSALARHRDEGWLLHPQDWQSWAPEDRGWLRSAFEPLPPLGVDEALANLAGIVGRLRERSEAPILIYNLSAVAPGEAVHIYQGLDETLSTRIRRFNLGLVELSADTGVSIIDVDRIVAQGGADRLKLDVVHLSADGCRRVAEEVVRVLDDLGVLEAAR